MPERELRFKIFRHNPFDPESEPRMEEFRLAETPRMTLFTTLSRIREEMDPTLQFDFVCRAAVCGSCAMLVNGKPKLACRTRIEDLPKDITLMPLPFFKLVADLSVDTGEWFRDMGTRVESWIESQEAFDPKAEELRMSNETAAEIYELDRCIECGCCVAACGAAQMNPSYLGATGLFRMARFLADPRDSRPESTVFDIVSTEEGIFGCIGLAACEDYCPKDLPLTSQLAYLRRKTTSHALRK
jgi:fumarate reductase iron-sulfur subunit